MSNSASFVAINSQPHRERLVAALQASGLLHSPHMAQAFLKTPREAFISAFYQREPEPGMIWTLRTANDSDPELWLDQIYQDEPLITKLDERKWPISSSSAPSVMVRMLEALDIQPGDRVLEIGCGTGYNAAILAHLTHDPALVTTVELDETMAARSGRILQTIVGSILVHSGDGRFGVVAHAPYQKIIATASASYIPRAWYEQLAPGGRLVMDLQGKQSASGFLVIEKSGDGTTAKGTFWQPLLCFMPLIDPHSPAESARSLFQLPCAEEIAVEPESPFPAIFQDFTFRWFLQWSYRTLTVSLPFPLPGKTHLSMVLKDTSHGTILQLNQQDTRGWQGKQRGGYPLWEQVQRVYERFVHLLQPGPECYEVLLDNQQAQLFLLGNDKNDPLVFCDLYCG